MFKQLVVLSSLIAGVGLAGTGMYLQYNPLAFTQPPKVNLNTYLYGELQAQPEPRQQVHAARPAALEATPPAEVAALMNEEEEEAVVVLPPVIVTRSPKAMTWRVAPVAHVGNEVPAAASDESDIEFLTPIDDAAPASPRPLKPCSGFRELGPTNVDQGVPSGERGVRDLC